MGEVISFNIEKSKYNDKVIKIFNSMLRKVNYIKTFGNLDLNDSLRELEYFTGYIEDLSIKYKERTWKNEDIQKHYISMMYRYKDAFREDRYNRHNIFFSEIIFTYLTDIYPSIVYEDQDFLIDLVSAFDTSFSYYLNTDKEDNRKKVSILLNPSIKKLIGEDEEIYRQENIEDILTQIDSGLTIPEIINLFKESDEMDRRINLDEGIITIDKIHEHYLFQTKLLMESLSEKELMDQKEYIYHLFYSLKYLIEINDLDESKKTLFIFMINEKRKSMKKENRVNTKEEVLYVTLLSDLYKTVDNDIHRFSIKEINSIINYCIQNKCSIDALQYNIRIGKIKLKKGLIK
ncbi:MAG: hypothetical protein IKF36_03505 [Bacilli bacterium]|nr:hypothetical protein [Bacilli bacterium]